MNHMQLIRSTTFLCLFAWSLTACSGLASRSGAKQDTKQNAPQNTGQEDQSANQASNQPSANDAVNQPSSNDAVNQLIDTTKLKTDLNNVLNSIASGKPDTNVLKMTAKDVLTTTHDMLSDSGIDKMYGNSNDPAVKAAAEALKKFRNATGATPAALDSLRKAAAQLNNN